MAVPRGQDPRSYHSHPAGGSSPIPGAPQGAAAPNGLAAFAASPMGQMWTQANQMYGPTKMANYPSAFQGGLDAARGSIAQMLHGSLADIANSQQHAEAALGQYAPQVNSAWQEGQGQLNNATQASNGALARYGANGGLAAADLAPERLAMNATHANDLSDQALLNTGISQQAESSRAQANLAAQDRYGQLDQLQAQLTAQQQAAAQQQQYAQQNALQQFGLNMLNNAQQFKQQKALNANAAQTNNSLAGGTFGQAGFTQGQITTAMQSPQYSRYSSIIGAAKAGTPESAQLAQHILDATSANPALQAILMQKYGDFFGAAGTVETDPAAIEGAVGPGSPYQNPLLNKIANDNSLTGRVIQAPGRGLVGAGRWVHSLFG